MLVLQNLLVGSILANILLMLGVSIVCGCFNRTHQSFNQVAGHMSANLLSLAATSLLIPTAASLLSQSTAESLLKQSRGASFILIAVYISYLTFQFWTHHEVFRDPSEKVATRQEQLESLAPTGLHDAVANIAVITAVPANPNARQGQQDNISVDDESEEGP